MAQPLDVMPKGIKYVPNPAFVPEMEHSLLLTGLMAMAAKTIADKATELAPVDDGEFRDGITSTTVVEGGRVKGRAMATDWRSGWIEFGTSRTPAHATFRRACDALGLKLRGGRRFKWRPSSRGGWY